MEVLQLNPASIACGTVKLPGSKSISNRTLLLAALANSTTEVCDLLVSDDTARMLEALQALGVKLEKMNDTDWIVHGCGGNFPNKNAELFLGNAGTAFRPLTAALALSGGHYTLSGVPRMHERPIGDLVDALRQIGANIEYLGNEGFPPLKISPAKIDVSKPIKIRGDVSSQFLTALLIALPLTGKVATIEVVSELISKPYIDITLNLMAKFGVQVQRDGWQNFAIRANSQYQSPGRYYVEGDASSASYFLAAGAIGRGPVRVLGINRYSIQGDVNFTSPLGLEANQSLIDPKQLTYMGANISWGDNWIECSTLPGSTKLNAIDYDCNHIPDAAMTLAILALFAEGTTTLRNIASWRVKETDRIAAMATELRKVGATVEEGADYIKITPPAKLIPNAVIDTYDDHRMAMCFSLVCLGGVPVTINDPGCVAKTFPDYFNQFSRIVR
ncbi:MAG: 3-phosphoshikimate 1-carboxyvinyltransferase [Methylophilales bacterium]|nr:3-phosphoshikimate 1-carboxyvinyltransferase [Methylophilales bacterium]